MKILVVTGSRADFGMLEWPIKLLKEDPYFDIEILNIRTYFFDQAFGKVERQLKQSHPDVLLVLGDRYEILATVIAAHLQRIPIAHIGGGDVTEGSYDDAMRDAISRMASIHFVTSTSAMARLTHMGYRNVHLVGSPSIDYIRYADWKKERPFVEPYVVVSYQAETIDGTNEIGAIIDSLPTSTTVKFILPNPDKGSGELIHIIRKYSLDRKEALLDNTGYYDFLPHADFLNLIYHCDEFIGNSSSMLYEAPELGIKTRMIGKRQKGRVIPWGDGHASERIIKVLKYGSL